MERRKSSVSAAARLVLVAAAPFAAALLASGCGTSPREDSGPRSKMAGTEAAKGDTTEAAPKATGKSGPAKSAPAAPAAPEKSATKKPAAAPADKPSSVAAKDSGALATKSAPNAAEKTVAPPSAPPVPVPPVPAPPLTADVTSPADVTAPPKSGSSSAYPAAPRADVVEEIHGVKVADPFRPLEEPDAPATRAWIDAQNVVTRAFLDAVPSRNEIRARVEKLLDFERFSLPRLEGGRVFYRRNDGLQQQDVLWVADSEAADPRVLLDPNALSQDGTVALARYVPSRDGKLLAYATSAAGSDWQEWRVRDVASGKDLADHLRFTKFTEASWLPDGSGFFYSRYPEPEAGATRTAQHFHQKLYFHRLGTPQAEDRLVHERPDQKEWGFGAQVTDDGAYLTLSIWRGTERRNAFSYRELSAGPDAPFVDLLTEWDASYWFLGNEGTVFYFQTDLNAPRGRIVAIDVTKPDRASWREVVPESLDALEGSSRVGARLFATYLHDARSLVKTFDLAGAPLGEVPLPGIGSANGFEGRTTDTVTFFSFTSFTTPSTILRFDLASGEVRVYRRPQVDFKPEDYETVQTFATSRDGTRVPVFVTAKKGISRDAPHRLVLSGYGGFGNATTPYFSVSNLAWMERGGVFAAACIRGGGEYGREWHLAGTKLRKQNSFDDFIASAEHLIAEGWTTSRRLAIQGGSNGGLLVGACMTQRPELFGACLPAVGVMDMLRFHKFTIGWAWTSDYGSAEDPEEFKALLAYSPLHNLKQGTTYPATLVTTADTDDRVVPAHSLKFAAALQEAHKGTAPVLLRVETRAGHGAGKPTSKILDEVADRWAFLDAVLAR